MATKLQFTKAAIEALPPGSYQDEAQRGLIIKVTENSKRFSLYAWMHGRPTKKALGRYPEITVSQAREAVRKLLGAQHLPKPKKIVTLGEVVKLYTAQLESLDKKCTTFAEDALRLNWSDMKNMDIEEITVPELSLRYAKIKKERGPAAARRAITVMRILYKFAIDQEFTERNPAKKVKMASETSRKVVLDSAEKPILRMVLGGMYHPTDDISDYFLLALNTGLRRANVSGMEWDWWHPAAGLIVVPPRASKNGEQMEIVVNAEAEEILARRQATARSNKFVFPSSKSASGHLTEPWFWLKEIRSRMAELGFAKVWTIHDLRRTFATDLTGRGAPLPVVSRSLGHKSMASTSVYARPGTDAVREWMDRT